ncbi:putative toxin-antitoxin system toxin component, PIN family [Neobacillus drentensis]|uniref:putative toxin-antitoxin system toxin component, PIN family n=1 Tax=Neobacillus drentensis TaxID=220684 RepID=UPI002FFE1124
MSDKIVVDTCVFIEGIFGEDNNPSSILLSMLDTLDIRLIFSQESIGELLYILKKRCNELQMDSDDTNDILKDMTILFQKGKSVNIRHYKSMPQKLTIKDPDDQMFVDAAFAGKATYLITLDKKSGILGLKKRVPFNCCTPQEFLGLINKENIAETG